MAVWLLRANMKQLDWIAVDWGTSSLRIWGLGADNQQVFYLASDEGMASMHDAQAFETTLLKHFAPYLPADKSIPVLCCGMVGAKQGWHDVGYQVLPCNPLSQQSPLRVPDTDPRLKVWILPGLSQQSPADVMRGEETQIAGLLSKLSAAQPFDGMICLPGTHSKWAQIEADKVTQFATFLTGELFALLGQQSVLRFSVSDSEWCEDTFVSAVKEAYANPAQLSHLVFSVRAADVLAQPQGKHGKARLSGLLIGLELAGAKGLASTKQVQLVGNDDLAKLYQTAMSALGLAVVVQSGDDLVLLGLQSAYQQISE
jgi:2-dehydro-3-deoxygalactonokinase